jgi:hypothetical protein
MIRALAAVLLLAAVHARGAGADVGTKATGGSRLPDAILVEIDGLATPYKVASAFTLPGESVSLRARVAAGGVRKTVLVAPEGTPVEHEGGWQWRAPSVPGAYAVTLVDDLSRASVLVNVFVMRPHGEVRSGALNGYRIGSYPPAAKGKPRRGSLPEAPPRGFVEVTEANQGTFVSPHFRLGQFLCKQAGAHPKYVVLDPRLPLKLERVLELVNSRFRTASTLHVMSGYRTPFYNDSLGNVTYSHHQWGAAADVFVDVDEDGRMDDLDGNRKVEVRDAHLLRDWIEAMSEPEGSLVGGLSAYPATSGHGPFVHVDVRGYRARW